MNKIGILLYSLVEIAGKVFINSILQGTIFCIIYPHIHSLFLNAADLHYIPSYLGWWDSVCIVWIFALLFRNHSTVTHVSNFNLKNPNEEV